MHVIYLNLDEFLAGIQSESVAAVHLQTSQTVTSMTPVERLESTLTLTAAEPDGQRVHACRIVLERMEVWQRSHGVVWKEMAERAEAIETTLRTEIWQRIKAPVSPGYCLVPGLREDLTHYSASHGDRWKILPLQQGGKRTEPDGPRVLVWPGERPEETTHAS